MKKIVRIIFLSLIGIGVLSTFYYLWKKAQPKVVVYELVSPQNGTIENKTVATGKIEPRYEALIKPQISGIISELKKEAGDKIKAGEVIATIKVIPEMVQLNSAESRVRVAEINLSQQQQVFDRQKQLYKTKVISKEDFETSEAEYKRALEELDNAKDARDIIKDGINNKSRQTSNTQVRSTIDGMILDIPVKVGNSVILSNNFNDGTTIASVANMNDMIFKGKVDETEVGRIHTGMPIKLSVGALDNFIFDATLEYISPKGEEENGATLFEIRAAAHIPDSVFIRAGYSANAEIILRQATNVQIIPESTIEFNGDSTFVHVLTSEKEGQIFEKRPIKIGLSDGINVEIKEGLSSDERIRGGEKQETKK